MPDFSELFHKSKGKPIVYLGQEVRLADFFPVENGDTLVATIESSNGSNRQGFFVDVKGSVEIEGKTHQHKKGIKAYFWRDTAPKEIRLKIFTKEPTVVISNVWEQTDHRGKAYTDFWTYGAGMIVEEIENGRRYRCNDWEPDEDFNDIVFTVQRVPKES